jgi:hypothetical protein
MGVRMRMIRIILTIVRARSTAGNAMVSAPTRNTRRRWSG